MHTPQITQTRVDSKQGRFPNGLLEIKCNGRVSRPTKTRDDERNHEKSYHYSNNNSICPLLTATAVTRRGSCTRVCRSSSTCWSGRRYCGRGRDRRGISSEGVSGVKGFYGLDGFDGFDRCHRSSGLTRIHQ